MTLTAHLTCRASYILVFLALQLYDWDKQELISLVPGVLDATNVGDYLSDSELLTGDYGALKSNN